MINFSKMRFLVVDDFSEFRSSIRGILGLLAVTKIDVAANGEDVLELCRRNRYDVILHDYNLGDGVSGQQVLERLHAEKLLPPQSVFIMVTAENTQAMVLAAIECEPDDYLNKPFSKASLQTRLERNIRRKQILLPVLSAVEQGADEQVLLACQQIEANEPRHAPLCHKHKALALYNLGRFDQLAQMLEQQARSRPTAWSLQMLAQLWLQQQKTGQLEPLLTAAVKQFPLLPGLHDVYADLYMRRHDLSAVVQALQAGVSMSPNTIKRQILLVRYAWLAGQPEVAVHAIRQCWEIGRYSIAFDAELLWLMVSLLLQGSDRSKEEAKGWLRHLEKYASQQSNLQPLAKLLQLVQSKDTGAQVQDCYAELSKHKSQYADISLLLAGDWLQQLGAQQEAQELWSYCAQRYGIEVGVSQQLQTRLANHNQQQAQEQSDVIYQALALHLNGDSQQAMQQLVQLSQSMPDMVLANITLAKICSARHLTGSEYRNVLQQSLGRIEKLSALDAHATDFARMNNPLETKPW